MVAADVALYEAKGGGRNRVAVHASEEVARGAATGRSLWSQRILTALEEDRLVLHAQPMIDVRDGSVVQHELLVRLREDDVLTMPGMFLRHAQRLGLMTRIDRWVIDRAAALVAANPDAVLAVNLSGRSVTDPSLLDHVARSLERHGASGRSLVFEITEHEALDHVDRARELSRGLRALGCRVALDDFGAGFAGFGYLKQLDFDLLKIDGEFIRELADSRADQLVVKALVAVARGLGCQTVAEYVCDERVAAEVTACGVDFAQGFAISQPVPVEDVLAPPAG